LKYKKMSNNSNSGIDIASWVAYMEQLIKDALDLITVIDIDNFDNYVHTLIVKKNLGMILNFILLVMGNVIVIVRM